MKLDQHQELERFSARVLPGRAVLEPLGPFEHRLAWEDLDRVGSSRTMTLRSGLTLSISRVRWERGWTLAFNPDPSKIKFIVARGPGPRVSTPDGQGLDLLHGTAQISRMRGPGDLRFDFPEAESGAPHEELCLEVSRDRLCELIGTEHVPAILDRVWSSTNSYPFEVLSAPAASFRLLDELLHCDARGAARQLHLEAKGLELLANWIDHLEREQLAGAALASRDVERLERARRVLLSRIAEPPRLAELARLVGLGEAKLKAGFRAHFGDTVYGYLRRHRLEEAYRLLQEGHYNVTEVALQVGYSNPSKFGTAFKARYGRSPSRLR